MEHFQNILINIGTKANSNKYLGAISRAFIKIMPLTICGALAVLWTNVLVNETTGLGAIWKPIMNLSFLNPLFNAISFCTTDCIALFVTFVLGKEIARANKNSDETLGGVIAVSSLIAVSLTTQSFTAGPDVMETVRGVFSGTLGSNGLFTGMITAIISNELFSLFFNARWTKIHLPEQVPSQIADSFNAMIPSFMTLIIVSALGQLSVSLSGYYINDLITSYIQKPLTYLGGSLPGTIGFTVIIGLFWAMGLHGDNMVGGVLTPIMTALTTENLSNIANGLPAANIICGPFRRIFLCTGGTGMVLGLTLAILIFGKRPENKSVGKLALVPNLFNIGEINMFGLPVVLNPVLIIPFIIAPVVTVIIGYFLTAWGFCPIASVSVPWTMPLFLYGWLATGSIRGGIAQLICVIISVLIYAPFIKIYEKQQEKQQSQND